MKEKRKTAHKPEEKTLVLFDTEEEYAQLMTDFLGKQKDLPWGLRTYTDMQELMKDGVENAALLVVAESAYRDEFSDLAGGRLVVLSESGLIRWKQLRYVDKYQRAEDVLKYLLEVYMETADTPLPRLQKSCRSVFIGSYSPVHRSMQTSMTLTLSQILAREHTTLYLNFEHFAGLPELVPDNGTHDIADLLYFLGTEKEKFRLRLQTMIRRIGNLDYVPPMRSGQNLLTVTASEWLAFFQGIEELGEYEYVVLDLSESMQGLFQILRLCRRVFTVTRDDRISRSKLLQYEQLLALCEYGDVLEKTKRFRLPHIRRLPEELEQLTKSELAQIAKELIKDIAEPE